MTEQGESRVSVELQEVEIPLSFRLAHLGIDTAAIYPKLTAQQIADTLGIEYRVHTVGGKWLPWVRDYQDYAGIL